MSLFVDQLWKKKIIPVFIKLICTDLLKNNCVDVLQRNEWILRIYDFWFICMQARNEWILQIYDFFIHLLASTRLKDYVQVNSFWYELLYRNGIKAISVQVTHCFSFEWMISNKNIYIYMIRVKKIYLILYCRNPRPLWTNVLRLEWISLILPR